MLRTALIFLGIVVGLWLLLLLILLALGKRTPRVLLLVAVGWVASPIDLIPEFIPFLGPLDDAVVAALVLRRILKTAGENVVRDHWRGDDATLDKILRLSGSKRGRGGLL